MFIISRKYRDIFDIINQVMIDIFPFVTRDEWALISNDHYNFYLRGLYLLYFI